MDLVVIDPPADLIAERQRLGIDNYDEVWGGVYHAVHPPSGEHQRIALEILVALYPCAKARGLQALHFNICPPNDPIWHDVRVPDIVVFSAIAAEEHAVTGAADAVIDIYEPGDETFEKLPFYERRRVGEVVIIHRDTRAVRRWVNGPDGLIESAADDDGRHLLSCLPVQLSTGNASLLMVVDGVLTEI